MRARNEAAILDYLPQFLRVFSTLPTIQQVSGKTHAHNTCVVSVECQAGMEAVISHPRSYLMVFS